MDTTELGKSKKAKVVLAGVAAVLGLATAGKVSPEIAVIVVGAMVCTYELGQAVIDAVKEKSK